MRTSQKILPIWKNTIVRRYDSIPSYPYSLLNFNGCSAAQYALQPLSYDHRCIRGAILEEELVPYPLIFIAKPLTHRSFIGFFIPFYHR